jgi:hypothetical protein
MTLGLASVPSADKHASTYKQRQHATEKQRVTHTAKVSKHLDKTWLNRKVTNYDLKHSAVHLCFLEVFAYFRQRGRDTPRCDAQHQHSGGQVPTPKGRPSDSDLVQHFAVTSLVWRDPCHCERAVATDGCGRIRGAGSTANRGG